MHLKMNFALAAIICESFAEKAVSKELCERKEKGISNNHTGQDYPPIMGLV